MLKLAGSMLCQHVRCTSEVLRHMHGRQEAERLVGSTRPLPHCSAQVCNCLSIELSHMEHGKLSVKLLGC